MVRTYEWGGPCQTAPETTLAANESNQPLAETQASRDWLYRRGRFFRCIEPANNLERLALQFGAAGWPLPQHHPKTARVVRCFSLGMDLREESGLDGPSLKRTRMRLRRAGVLPGGEDR